MLVGVALTRRSAPCLARNFSSTVAKTRTAQGKRLILAFETSCDDSCAALVSCDDSYNASAFAATRTTQSLLENPPPQPKVVASAVIRQDHQESRGIQPLKAHKYHMRDTPRALWQCLEKGNISSDGQEIDAVAFTQGPGMAGCLGVGMMTAKALATAWNKPLIPVHHMEAHALTPLLLEKNTAATASDALPLKFPFLTFLLSGGHTLLVLAKGPSDYQILAQSDDEAIGAGLDSAARYFAMTTDWTRESPGATLEAFASDAPAECPEGLQSLLKPFKIPLRSVPQLSYSFLTPGLDQQLDTIIKHGSSDDKVATMQDLPLDWQKYIAAGMQRAAFEQLQDKVKMIHRGATYLASKRSPPQETLPLARKFKPKEYPADWASAAEAIASCNHLVVSGGVASNSLLRSMLVDVWGPQYGKRLIFPPVSLCVDNAVMIANVGALYYDQYVHPQTGQRIEDKFQESLQTLPRAKWSLETLATERGLR